MPSTVLIAWTDVRALVGDMLAADPATRPTSDDIVARLTSADDGRDDAAPRLDVKARRASERFEPPSEVPQPKGRQSRRGSTFLGPPLVA